MEFARNPRFECVGKNALVSYFSIEYLAEASIEPGEKRSATRLVTRRIGLYLFILFLAKFYISPWRTTLGMASSRQTDVIITDTVSRHNRTKPYVGGWFPRGTGTKKNCKY